MEYLRGSGCKEALALASRHLDRYFEAELHRLHGLLLGLEPAEPAAAEAALHRALAVAKARADGGAREPATVSPR